jgi:small-conductance mechanosensitive channel
MSGERCEVIRSALKGVPGVSEDPAPEAIPWELAGSSVNIKVRWWTRPQRADVVHVRGRVIQAVQQALAGAGIDLPFPTNVVLLHDQTEEPMGTARASAKDGPRATTRPPHVT